MYLLVVEVESSAVRDPDDLGVGRGSAAVRRAPAGHQTPAWGWKYFILTVQRAGPSDLPRVPDSLTQEEAGKSPSLPFLPVRQGDWYSTSVVLKWKVSSQLGLLPPDISIITRPLSLQPTYTGAHKTPDRVGKFWIKTQNISF